MLLSSKKTRHSTAQQQAVQNTDPEVTNLKPDSYLVLFKDLPLSKADRRLLQRFGSGSHARSFLQVAELLTRYGFAHESLQLLAEGLQQNPEYKAARLQLMRAYLFRGLAEEAWRLFCASPHSLRGHTTAMRLALNACILRQNPHDCADVWAQMCRRRLGCRRSQSWMSCLQKEGLAAARRQVVKEWVQEGAREESFEAFFLDPAAPASLPTAHFAPPAMSRLDLAKAPEAKMQVSRSSQGKANLQLDFDIWRHERRQNERFVNLVHRLKRFVQTESVSKCQLKGSSLEAVFRGTEHYDRTTELAQSDLKADHLDWSASLDSEMLVDVYARQGHYSKAVAICRRMLKTRPGDEALLAKMRQLIAFKEQQRMADSQLDPEWIDRMEMLESIDRRVKYFGSVLDVLERGRYDRTP